MYHQLIVRLARRLLSPNLSLCQLLSSLIMAYALISDFQILACCARILLGVFQML